MTALDWLLFGLIGYTALVALVVLLVRGGALGEAEEERARARYLYERGAAMSATVYGWSRIWDWAIREATRCARTYGVRYRVYRSPDGVWMFDAIEGAR